MSEQRKQKAFRVSRGTPSTGTCPLARAPSDQPPAPRVCTVRE